LKFQASLIFSAFGHFNVWPSRGKAILPLYFSCRLANCTKIVQRGKNPFARAFLICSRCFSTRFSTELLKTFIENSQWSVAATEVWRANCPVGSKWLRLFQFDSRKPAIRCKRTKVFPALRGFPLTRLVVYKMFWGIMRPLSNVTRQERLLKKQGA